MSEWQDISTAPKDGTYFLLCSKETGTIVKAHFNYNALSPTDSQPFSWNINQCVWMPLPKPPKKAHKCCMEGIVCKITDKDLLVVNFLKEIPDIEVNFCPVCGESK